MSTPNTHVGIVKLDFNLHKTDDMIQKFKYNQC